ncbi:hypothetical protein FGO68_gene10080 [Halteria grandinella]|uniref:Uncharacterized protein n=1 Tax=Halteria grandinella TaxID=5974 RepID=A0A8J8NTX7_HALGN|nr:hypothetical protein FGO68_gene10080 [Halteria grandinella]
MQLRVKYLTSTTFYNSYRSKNKRSKTIIEKREAKQKAKELQPKKPHPEPQPWRETHNHNYEFEADIKRMTGVVLSNTEINRVNNLIPRSYDKSIPLGKDQAFRLTSRFGREFGQDFTHLLSDSGKTIINRNIDDYQKTYDIRRTKEEYYQTHKREFAEKAALPKWNPADGHGGNFSRFPTDANHYRAKSLLPLDAKPLQDKPFLRTTTMGWHFKHETASVI